MIFIFNFVFPFYHRFRHICGQARKRAFRSAQRPAARQGVRLLCLSCPLPWGGVKAFVDIQTTCDSHLPSQAMISMIPKLLLYMILEFYILRNLSIGRL